MSKDNNRLRLAVPRGRILEELLPLLSRSGIKPESSFLDSRERKLEFETNIPNLSILRVRSFDIATFVAFGAAQMGVAGKDVLMEFGYSELYAPLDLRIGECRMIVAESEKFRIKQIPSWFFPDIKKDSQNLITATTCLNEINDAAIIWFLVNSNKVLKQDGYIYIRDSAKLKPDRHIVNYDEVLVKEMGYELVKWYDLVNRKDIFAIPRIYQKKKNIDLDFDEFFNHILGREAITSHGGRYNQNLKKK